MATYQSLIVFDVLQILAGLTMKVEAAKIRQSAEDLNCVADLNLRPAFKHTES